MIQVDSKLVARVEVTKLDRGASRSLPVKRARRGTRVPGRRSGLVLILGRDPRNPRARSQLRRRMDHDSIRGKSNGQCQRRYSLRATSARDSLALINTADLSPFP